MSEILGNKLNIVYEDTLLEITPELMKKTIIKQDKEIETHITLNKQLLEDIDKAGKEIERLNNIIDKAIEYIDWQRRNPQYDNVWRNSECEDLIEILKGE